MASLESTQTVMSKHGIKTNGNKSYMSRSKNQKNACTLDQNSTKSRSRNLKNETTFDFKRQTDNRRGSVDDASSKKGKKAKTES